MSLQSIITKFNSPIIDLVLSVTCGGTELGGQSVADEKEVIGWVDKASKTNFVTENNIKVCFTRIFNDFFFCSITVF